MNRIGEPRTTDTCWRQPVAPLQQAWCLLLSAPWVLTLPWLPRALPWQQGHHAHVQQLRVRCLWPCLLHCPCPAGTWASPLSLSYQWGMILRKLQGV